jgi:3'-phosphoadenosine 5'-phosphosulfate sulfotransferase (PAPS reductase)/FAD synthetase
VASHIIALSGGKDSTVLALALQLYEPRDYIVVANPTGNELPEMEQHFRDIEAQLGLPIQRVGCGLSFEQLIYRERMIPNHWARFCTRVLKIEPTQEYLAQFNDPVLYVGLRADEESRGGADYGVECRFPFREWDWGLPEIRRFLRERERDLDP